MAFLFETLFTFTINQKLNMGDFKTALAITGRNEGGYSDNPNDRGSETYAGISRKFWPNLKMWPLIDEIKTRYKSANDINSAIKASPYPFEQYINDFYKVNFWDVNRLDEIHDQQICDTVYDFGVNSGVVQAAKFLQRSVGVKDDGQIGTGTLTAVNNANAKTVHNNFNQLRKDFYITLANKPGQSQFLKSWLSRLKPYKP